MVHCEFPDEHFDAVVDKACLDAIWCHAAGDAHLHYYLKQVERYTSCGFSNFHPQHTRDLTRRWCCLLVGRRILTPGGVYICVSSMPPDQQLRVLWNQDVRSPSFLSWEVDVQAIGTPNPWDVHSCSLLDRSSFLAAVHSETATAEARDPGLAGLEANVLHLHLPAHARAGRAKAAVGGSAAVQSEAGN